MRAVLATLILAMMGGAAFADVPPGPPPGGPQPPHGPDPLRHQCTDPIRAVRATEPIVIDGILDEPVWKADNAVVQFLQTDPAQGADPSQRTEVRIAYDDEAIYVGARMYDNRPDSIVARFARRDNDAGSDAFAVAFDTFRDRRNGYYFIVSAAGCLTDGTMMNDDWDDNSWDGVWTAKVNRDSLGWTAEMRIPFSQMRSRGGDRTGA